MTGDPLATLRTAIASQDWPVAYEEAKRLAVVDGEPAAMRADLLADAAWWLGRLDECIAAREQAYRRYDELGDREHAGQCAVWLFEHHLFVNKPTIAGAWLRRARTVLADAEGSVAYGCLLLREAEGAHGAGELDRASDLATQVVALARTLRSLDLEAQALQTQGRVLLARGDLADGFGHLDEAMLLALDGRLSPYSTGKVYCSLISACEEVGDLDRAAEWTEATLRWADKHPFAIFPGICRVHRAVVLKRGGALAAAEREALRAGEELGNSHLGNCAAAYAELGDIRRRLGELDEAEEAFARAQELCGQACGERALVRLAQGRVAAAVSAVAECLSTAPIGTLARARVLVVSVQVSIAAGDLRAAAAAAAELTAIVDVFATPYWQAVVASVRGRLELAEGVASAVDTLRRAVEAWEALGVPYEVATARTLMGQALRLAGEEAAAAAAFTAAAEQFGAIGARLDARNVYGTVRVPLPAGLTEREVQVLRLIVTGLTNNEIAGELHLSAKTVSRHISNIFTKVGVTSRTAAAAFAFENDLVVTQR